MISVRQHTENQAESWDRYVRRKRKQASCYHLWRWQEVMALDSGHIPYYLSAWQDDEICGVLPLIMLRPPWAKGALFSMPFASYGGVVGDSVAIRRALVSEAVELAERLGAVRLELRHRRKDVCELPARSHRVSMVLPLPDSEEALWKGIRGKLRNQVRKADRAGLRVQHGGLEHLGAFYWVFARNMRELGSPVWSQAFFRRVLRAFPERARIYRVDFGSLTVAAGLVFRFGNSVEIPWASSLREFNHLCGNVRMYWQILADSVNAGYESFDFGRSEKGGAHYRFKRHWGAIEEPLYWHYWPESIEEESRLEDSRERLEALWRKLPVWSTRLIGPPIRKWLPQ